MNMLKIPFNVGTVGGLSLLLIFIAMYYLGAHPLIFGPILFSPVPIVVIVYALLRIKNKVLGGKITFRQAFYSGIVTSFVTVSLFSFSAYIFITTLAHNFVEDYIQLLSIMIDKGGKQLTDLTGMIDMEEIRKALTPWTACQSLFFNGFFFSSIVSLIVALIIKNQKGIPEKEMMMEEKNDKTE